MTLSTIERIFLLQGADLFRQVPMQDLVSIAQLCREVNFTKGEQFIKEGETGDCLYIIATGDVTVVVEGVGRIGSSRQGEVIGEMAIISSNPRVASCIADTEVTALQITHNDFWTLMEENSAVALSVLRVIVTRLEDALQKLRIQSGQPNSPSMIISRKKD